MCLYVPVHVCNLYVHVLFACVVCLCTHVCVCVAVYMLYFAVGPGLKGLKFIVQV